MDVEYQRYVDPVEALITQRPGTVVVAFLLVTALFSVGLGAVETEAGTEQFAEDVPEEQALQEVERLFSPRFETDTGSTQLLHSAENVLARHELVRMLRAQERLAERPGLRVTDTASAAAMVAAELDPEATTPGEQRRVLERATDAEVRRAVRRADERNPRFSGLVSTDFNRQSASASATIGVVTHEVPGGLASGAGEGGENALTPIQQEADSVVASVGGDIRVFGAGIIAAEFGAVIGDTLALVIPAAVLLITLFLLVAYRDLADLVLGVVALLMALVWTFGFTGLVGIPFSQVLIAVPPLLLAVGIDFGIHAVNRYREERVEGWGIGDGMARAADQVLVAFFVVTGTTVIGFAANLTSELVPIREFGIVAAIGIVFTFLIFGIFLPAAKVTLDRLRTGYPIPTFSTAPLGASGSVLGTVQGAGVTVARAAPIAFLVVVLVSSGAAGFYATGVDTTFDTEDFLPPEEPPAYYEYVPERIEPGEYTVARNLEFLERHFESGQDDAVTVYLEGPMREDHALEAIHRAGEDPPASFVERGGRADETSIVTVIDDHAARDPEFRRLVERNDVDGNGVPDRNLPVVYDHLLDSPARAEALQYVSEDLRSARVVYSVEAGTDQRTVTEDARTVADRHRFEATPTGDVVVFQAISELILASALTSLGVALAGTAVFLVFIYWVLLGRASLGVANVVPVLVTVAFLGGTMRFLGLSFNAFTATILAITIGLGIDYSVHVTHRFADEYEELGRDRFASLERTVGGTGGALTGSMLTTVSGIGVLVISIFPAIGQFGLLTGISVFYAYLASLYVLPSVLVVWASVVDGPARTLAG